MKIILAYDGSEHAERALDKLTALIRPPAEVLVVSALPGMALDADGNPAEPDPEEVRRVKQHLDAATQRLGRSSGFTVSPRMLVGDPATVITQLAHDAQPDLIVTGSHGRGLAGRMVFGSVSAAILHHVHCPVMVVK